MVPTDLFVERKVRNIDAAENVDDAREVVGDGTVRVDNRSVGSQPGKRSVGAEKYTTSGCYTDLVSEN